MLGPLSFHSGIGCRSVSLGKAFGLAQPGTLDLLPSSFDLQVILLSGASAIGTSTISSFWRWLNFRALWAASGLVRWTYSPLFSSLPLLFAPSEFAKGHPLFLAAVVVGLRLLGRPSALHRVCCICYQIIISAFLQAALLSGL